MPLTQGKKKLENTTSKGRPSQVQEWMTRDQTTPSELLHPAKPIAREALDFSLREPRNVPPCLFCPSWFKLGFHHVQLRESKPRFHQASGHFSQPVSFSFSPQYYFATVLTRISLEQILQAHFSTSYLLVMNQSPSS